MTAKIIQLPLDLPGDSKCCTVCGMVKSLDKFGTHFDKRDGKTYHFANCRTCTIKKRQEIRLAKRYEKIEKLPSGTKRCTKCGEIKHISAYYTNALKDGTPCLYSRCRPCAIADKKDAYHRLKDKIKIVQKKCRDRKRDAGVHTDHYIVEKLRGLKHKSKKLGIKFDLVTSDIIIPEYCPVLGIKLSRNRNQGGEASPSIDRIIPSKGYVKDNIVVVSLLANCIKFTATVEQIRAVADFYERLEKNNGGQND